MALGCCDWKPGGRRRFQKLRSDPEVFLIAHLVAQERHVAMTDMLRRTRGPGRAAAARQLAIYLSHIVLERPQDVVADLFGRDRTTVAHAVQAVEDLRDDPRLDAQIARIEARFDALRAPEARHAA